MSPNCRSHEAEDGREQSEAPVHGNQDCKRIRSIRDTPPPLRRMPRRTQSATAMACQLETWQPNYEANGPLYKIRSHLAGFDRARGPDAGSSQRISKRFGSSMWSFAHALILSTIPSGNELRPPLVRRRCKAVRDRSHAVRQLSPSPRPAPQ
jgi:hypothetical protein